MLRTDSLCTEFICITCVYQIVATSTATTTKEETGRPIKDFRDSGLFQYQIYLYIVYIMIVPIFHTRTHLFGLKHALHARNFAERMSPFLLELLGQEIACVLYDSTMWRKSQYVSKHV